MDSYDFKTVEEIASYVRPKIDTYRQFPSKKNMVVEDLYKVFAIDTKPLAIVVKDGKFVESFWRKMGKGRMRALKKLLYAIDIEYYRQIDFKEQ